MNIGPTEAIIALVIILVLFGGSQLPKLAKNLGKAQKEFKDGLAEGQAAGTTTPTSTLTTPTTATEAPPATAAPAASEQPKPTE
jgi:sec-independent protein translocase protein TatA